MSHVVVAPDKFKGTLTAAQVAAHVAAGLGRASPGLRRRRVSQPSCMTRDSPGDMRLRGGE